MKSIWSRAVIVLIAVSALPSCTARYQQLLHEKDQKIKDLYSENAELQATNRDLAARELGARQRAASLEERLNTRQENGRTGLDELKRQLGPDVDTRVVNGQLTLGINNRVTFNSGSTVLKSSAGGVLANVANVLKRDFANQRIVIAGHTDTDPIQKTKDRYRDNRHLSVERADAVARYLVTKCGIAESAIVVAGYGEHNPLERGRTQNAKAANRRVEIVVGDPM